MEILMELAQQYGLFVALVVYVLWTNQNRENRYINVIDQLSDSFNEIKNDVKHIKEKLN